MQNRDISVPAQPQRIGILLLPDFPLMAYASIVEVLRGANTLSGRRLYDVVSISLGEEVVTASSGISIVIDDTIKDGRTYTMVIVCAGSNAIHFQNKRTFSWIRTLFHNGVRIGSASVGSIILARSGVVGKNRCTIHWRYMDSFKEEFPDIKVARDIYVIDRGIFTCAGGTSSFDLMCELVREAHGQRLSSAIREWFLYVPNRPSDQSQRSPLRERTGVHHPKLLRALEIMESSIEFPKSRKEIAEMLNITTRHLDRLFKTYLNMSFNEYYIRLRVFLARDMILQTELLIIDISIACGFLSASNFSNNFKKVFGESPAYFRKNILKDRNYEFHNSF